jgi:hypothetical protein
MLKLGRGVIGKLTSYFLVSYKHPDTGEKLVCERGMAVVLAHLKRVYVV